MWISTHIIFDVFPSKFQISVHFTLNTSACVSLICFQSSWFIWGDSVEIKYFYSEIYKS